MVCHHGSVSSSSFTLLRNGDTVVTQLALNSSSSSSSDCFDLNINRCHDGKTIQSISIDHKFLHNNRIWCQFTERTSNLIIMNECGTILVYTCAYVDGWINPKWTKHMTIDYTHGAACHLDIIDVDYAHPFVLVNTANTGTMLIDVELVTYSHISFRNFHYSDIPVNSKVEPIDIAQEDVRPYQLAGISSCSMYISIILKRGSKNILHIVDAMSHCTSDASLDVVDALHNDSIVYYAKEYKLVLDQNNVATTIIDDSASSAVTIKQMKWIPGYVSENSLLFTYDSTNTIKVWFISHQSSRGYKSNISTTITGGVSHVLHNIGNSIISTLDVVLVDSVQLPHGDAMIHISWMRSSVCQSEPATKVLNTSSTSSSNNSSSSNNIENLSPSVWLVAITDDTANMHVYKVTYLCICTGSSHYLRQMKHQIFGHTSIFPVHKTDKSLTYNSSAIHQSCIVGRFNVSGAGTPKSVTIALLTSYTNASSVFLVSLCLHADMIKSTNDLLSMYPVYAVDFPVVLDKKDSEMCMSLTPSGVYPGAYKTFAHVKKAPIMADLTEAADGHDSCRVADTRMLSTNHPIVYIDGSKLVLKVIHTSNSDRMYTISAASSSIILTMYDRIVTDVTATSNATVATADEPEGEYYSFDFVPDPHFGLGLRLDTGQASGAVFVHSFKRPGKDTILKLEAMGIISIGDELIGINGVDLQHLSLSETIGIIRSTTMLAAGSAINLRMRRPPLASINTSTSDSYCCSIPSTYSDTYTAMYELVVADESTVADMIQLPCNAHECNGNIVVAALSSASNCIYVYALTVNDEQPSLSLLHTYQMQQQQLSLCKGVQLWNASTSLTSTSSHASLILSVIAAGALVLQHFDVGIRSIVTVNTTVFQIDSSSSSSNSSSSSSGSSICDGNRYTLYTLPYNSPASHHRVCIIGNGHNELLICTVSLLNGSSASALRVVQRIAVSSPVKCVDIVDQCSGSGSNTPAMCVTTADGIDMYTIDKSRLGLLGVRKVSSYTGPGCCYFVSPTMPRVDNANDPCSTMTVGCTSRSSRVDIESLLALLDALPTLTASTAVAAIESVGTNGDDALEKCLTALLSATGCGTIADMLMYLQHEVELDGPAIVCVVVQVLLVSASDASTGDEMRTMAAAYALVSSSQQQLFDIFVSSYWCTHLSSDDAATTSSSVVRKCMRLGTMLMLSDATSSTGGECSSSFDILTFLCSKQVSIWTHDISSCRTLIEKVAMQKFKHSKSAMSVFLELVVLGKIGTLVTLSKVDKSDTGKQLQALLNIIGTSVGIDDDDSTDDADNAAVKVKLIKNAFALMRLGRYQQAAGVFLCVKPPMLKEATNVLSSQGGSPQLALLIARLVEASHPTHYRTGGLVLGSIARNVVTNYFLPDFANDRCSPSTSSVSIDEAALLLLASMWLQDVSILEKMADQYAYRVTIVSTKPSRSDPISMCVFASWMRSYLSSMPVCWTASLYILNWISSHYNLQSLSLKLIDSVHAMSTRVGVNGFVSACIKTRKQWMDRKSCLKLEVNTAVVVKPSTPTLPPTGVTSVDAEPQVPVVPVSKGFNFALSRPSPSPGTAASANAFDIFM